MALKFNPGEIVPQYATAEKGLSMLICCNRTTEEVEEIRTWEEAARVSKDNRNFDEVLKLAKTDPRMPAKKIMS